MKLADFALDSLSVISGIMRLVKDSASRWFRSKHQGKPVDLRLFCFPYAGGSSAIYRGWAPLFPSAIEVISVELPGRGGRLSEPALKSLPPLVDLIADAMLHLLDRPFAFFGHSMGALIAFELARHLQNNRGCQPQILFASGRRAPQIPMNEPTLHDLPKDEFISELRRMAGSPDEVLQNSELMEIMIPLLRADFQLNEDYIYLPGAPLGCPITAFGGLKDVDETRELLLQWKELTASGFALHMLPGDHFFLRPSQTQLIELVTRDLRNVMASSSRTS